MKEKIISISLIVIIVCFIPIFITTIIKGIPKEEKQNTEIENKKDIKVMVDGKEISMNLNDYLIGVVAAEMPVSFYDEALKAQAVAARTFALKKLEKDSKHIFNNNEQAYITKEKMEESWGSDNFPKNYNKIRSAVVDTNNEVVVYQEDLIEAVFHSTSAGMTQSAKDVWGEEIPYLISVSSSDDVNSPEYSHTQTFTQQEFVSLLNEHIEDFQTYTNDVFNEIQIISRTSEGYISQIQIGNKILEGEEVRSYLGLESSNFNVDSVDGNIEVSCKGYGHGVGMSQYGANDLAKNGYSYKDILKHYYSNTEIGLCE
ncbi:stage II sporulation protein D [Vallitalea longa]|uniref:Stage II sporulation protein D n=1 Tax=Vallitalea longa TaxID=2936439 RepID=A0A9W5Y9X3_9FIRM|nr:stage II sporulation protein D [Vallitalea longa]GKX28508.1 stage II sporulation protein D [Vallitalea longa]